MNRILFIIVFFYISLFASEGWHQKVYIFGKLANVLLYKGLGETFPLSKLRNEKSIYAVGLVQKLQGEIQIFDSKPYLTSMGKTDKIQIDKSFDKNASFLLYAKVPKWVSIKVPNTIYNKQQFVEFLEDTVKEYGINDFKPFPFILEGKIKANNYRVLTYRQNDTIDGYHGTCSCELSENQTKTPIKHITLSLQDTMLDTPVRILGFYSPSRGIITDQYSYTYMNFITKDKTIAGHCQKIMIGENMILKLPKVQQQIN